MGGDFGLNIIAKDYPKVVIIACDTSMATDAIEYTLTAGSSSLQYDPVAGQYIYVWKTDKLWANSCRQFRLMLDDTTMHVANFKFNK